VRVTVDVQNAERHMHSKARCDMRSELLTHADRYEGVADQGYGHLVLRSNSH
jgi:hypothetical protein